MIGFVERSVRQDDEIILCYDHRPKLGWTTMDQVLGYPFLEVVVLGPTLLRSNNSVFTFFVV